MSETAETKTSNETNTTDDRPKVHRVCTQCNNMFEVSFDKFETKICPNCHKG